MIYMISMSVCKWDAAKAQIIAFVDIVIWVVLIFASQLWHKQLQRPPSYNRILHDLIITIMARARPQRRTTKTPPMFWTLSGWAWRTSVKGKIMYFEAYVKFKLKLKGKENSQGAWLCGLVWHLGVLALVLSGAHVPRVLPPLVVQHLNINNVNIFQSAVAE